MSETDIAAMVTRLIAWAQNEEMVDIHYTQHGKDCLDAAAALERFQRDSVRWRDAVLLLKRERDEAREALEPFAVFYRLECEDDWEDTAVCSTCPDIAIKHFRRAAKVLDAYLAKTGGADDA